ncbi:unnamed protein product [Owenia fusiformis]|uniref:HMG box domain-containing protein n=1 Tax=Owenia fusiformis TaxID=6347 RepID=A0A8S4NID4_OWEFU|nr:unnamed protein product [Owenia fusiformis]
MEGVRQAFGKRRRKRIAARLDIEPPTTALQFFKKDFRVVLQKRNEDKNKHINITRRCLKKWKRMTAEEKKPYQEKAKADLKRFHAEKRAAEAKNKVADKNEGGNDGADGAGRSTKAGAGGSTDTEGGVDAGGGANADGDADLATKPLRPIRPQTAFENFAADLMEEMAEQKLPKAKVLNIARGRWEGMKDSEKEPYHAQVFEEKDEHDDNVEEYSVECKRHGIEEEEDEEEDCEDEEEYSSYTTKTRQVKEI